MGGPGREGKSNAVEPRTRGIGTRGGGALPVDPLPHFSLPEAPSFPASGRAPSSSIPTSGWPPSPSIPTSGWPPSSPIPTSGGTLSFSIPTSGRAPSSPPPFPLPLEPFAPFPRFRSVSSLPPPTISGRAFPVPTRVTQRQAELLQQPPISGHRFQHRIDDNRVPRRFVRQDVRISTRTRLEELRRRGRGSAGARPGAGRSSEGRT